MGRVKQDEIDDLIPISVSVKMLDEKYPWLKSLKWNDLSDEIDEVKPKRKKKE